MGWFAKTCSCVCLKHPQSGLCYLFGLCVLNEIDIRIHSCPALSGEAARNNM